MRTRAASLALAAAFAIGLEMTPAAQGRPVKTIKDGLLDDIKLYVDKPPAATQVVMIPFTPDERVKADNERVGVMGVAGGNSLDKLKSDTRDIGQDIAKFLNAWATGKKLD